MTAGGCDSSTTEMSVDGCEGPRLPSDSVPQSNSSLSDLPKSPSSGRFRRTILLNVGGEQTVNIVLRSEFFSVFVPAAFGKFFQKNANEK